MRALFVFPFLLLSLPARAEDCPAPVDLHFTVTQAIHRDTPGFTEGLELNDGALWESTGDEVGESRINTIDRRSGKVTAVVNAHKDYFGEGLTIFGGRLYQMTWREHRVFVRDLKGRVLRELRNPREGWGLTHDSRRLITSDGSDRIFFLSPQDFSTQGSITVKLGAQPVNQINELEYVDGAIWANVFVTDYILKISPSTGCVLGRANLSDIYDHMSDTDRQTVQSDSESVLNGIAYDRASGLFTITGKDWPVLFLGRFVED